MSLTLWCLVINDEFLSVVCYLCITHGPHFQTSCILGILLHDALTDSKQFSGLLSIDNNITPLQVLATVFSWGLKLVFFSSFLNSKLTSLHNNVMSMFCMKMHSTLNAVYLQCWMYPPRLLRPILCGKIFLLVLWKLYKVMCIISEFYLHVCKYSISKFLSAVILCPFAQFWKVTELLEHSLLLSQNNIYTHMCCVYM